MAELDLKALLENLRRRCSSILYVDTADRFSLGTSDVMVLDVKVWSGSHQQNFWVGVPISRALIGDISTDDLGTLLVAQVRDYDEVGPPLSEEK